jgi:hypothetical protein
VIVSISSKPGAIGTKTVFIIKLHKKKIRDYTTIKLKPTIISSHACA